MNELEDIIKQHGETKITDRFNHTERGLKTSRYFHASQLETEQRRAKNRSRRQKRLQPTTSRESVLTAKEAAAIKPAAAVVPQETETAATVLEWLTDLKRAASVESQILEALRSC